MPAAKEPQAPTRHNYRIIVARILATCYTSLTVVQLIAYCDAANQILNSKKLLIAQVKETVKSNLILTAEEDCNAQQIPSCHGKILKALTELNSPVTTVKEDCSWGKIMVHAVSREIFGGSSRIKRMQEEVEKFNKGVR